MIKHYINGKIKSDKEQEEHCKTCEKGEKFKNKEFIKHGKYQGDRDEIICGGCESKYYYPLIEADRLIDAGCDKCNFLSDDGQQCDNKDKFFLCIGNYTKIFKNPEVNKVNIEYVNKLEEYDRTGMCSHEWVNSEPFKTNEGYFRILNCTICKVGTLNYHGRKYTDNIMVLTRMLANNSLKIEVSRPPKVVIPEIPFVDYPQPLTTQVKVEPTVILEEPKFIF